MSYNEKINYLIKTYLLYAIKLVLLALVNRVVATTYFHIILQVMETQGLFYDYTNSLAHNFSNEVTLVRTLHVGNIILSHITGNCKI